MLGIGYSIWLVLLCIVVAFILSYYLYGSKLLANKGFNLLNISLFLLRFLSTFLLGFLLLSPFIRLKKMVKEKPIIVLAVDNSNSILNSKDSLKYKIEMNVLSKELAKKYDVEILSYSEKTSLGLKLEHNNSKGKRTNISEVFNYVNDVFEEKNIGAVILAGDGHFNAGTNPLFATYNINAPLITWAFGDSTIYPDLQIKEVINNDVAYRGNKFPVMVRVSIQKLKGKTAQVKLLQNGKVVQSKSIVVKTDNYFKEVSFLIDANTVGLKKYTAIISANVSEKNTLNNRSTFVVDVLDNRSNIIIVYGAPHPDVAAWANSLKDENTKVKTTSVAALNLATAKKAKALILHGLPLKTGNTSKFNALINMNKPILFISNVNTNFSLLNTVLGNEINVKNAKTITEITANPQSNFLGFNISEELKKFLIQAPPLQVPYDAASNSVTADVLATQQYGTVSTKIPLIAFTNKTKVKYGVWFGEGFWLWRVHEYAKSKNFNQSQELAHFMVQNVVSGSDLRKFKITQSKKYFYEDENPTFEAELYNNSYEILKGESIRFVLKNMENETQKYTFGYGNNGYNLKLASLTPGEYKYSAKVLKRNNFKPVNGRFVIKPLNVETLSNRANFPILRKLALKHGGKAFVLDNANTVNEYITTTLKPKTKLHQVEQLKHWINWKIVLGIILLLLVIEWFLRKREGVI